MNLPHWGILLALVVLGVGGLLLIQRMLTASVPVVINGTAVPPAPTLDPNQVSQGAALYAQHCAECHGVNLEGAPDWKRRLADGSLPPPPHDSSGHTWHHADSLLRSIIVDGGDAAFNSKMPAFGAKLTDEEIGVILEFIKSRWGKEERDYQWWITMTSDASNQARVLALP